MATKNSVTLTFAGDSADLEKAFDRVGQSADEMGREVRTAGESFDRVGEQADNLDTRAMGFRDTLTGIQDGTEGVKKAAAGDWGFETLLLLGFGIGDLASGFYNLLIPAMKSSVAWLGKTRAATLAQAAAGKVVSAATKVWAGVQAAFNFVMALNPITLVVVAIVALVAIIVIAYKRSDTFRRIVDGAFRGVLRVGRVVVGWFRENFPPLARALSAPFVSAFRLIRSAWNSTVGGRGFTVPDWIPGLGGRSFRIPTFHQGGIMPGAPGTEGLALLQAGERITPANQSGTSVRITVERGSGTSAERAFADLILTLIRTGALALSVRDGRVVVAGG